MGGRSGHWCWVPEFLSLTDGVDKVDEATALAPAELLMGFRLIDPPPPGRCVWNCDLGYAGTTFIAFGGGRQIWFASVLRFCTIAARWNSSRAPERPRNRIRSKRWWVFSLRSAFPSSSSSAVRNSTTARV